MKLLRLLIVFCLLIIVTGLKAQMVIDTTSINPADIPSPETMKAMGLPNDLIQKVMDYKMKNLNKIQVPNSDTARRNALMKANMSKLDTSKYYRPIDTAALRKYPAGRIFGQDLFRNKNIKYFAKATQTAAPDNYVLDIGDQINISIWGFAEYNDVFQLGNEGYIVAKYIGRVYVKGLKFGDAKALLVKKFSEVTDLKNSRIEIILNYSKVINVNIVGEVYNPGTYSIPALNTVFNALVAAAGPTQIGSVRNIYLKRNNKIVDSLDVYKFLTDPDSKNDIYLENNDYIIVGAALRVASISGMINRPHNYELKGTETINSLIKYAGGLMPSAYTSNIQVRRYTNNKTIMININLDSLKQYKTDFEIENGDQVFVDKISDELTNIITAIGAVKIPGSYQFKEGDRIEDLLKKAQGLTYDAYIPMAYVVRKKDDQTKKYLSINLSNVLSDKNSPDNILLQRFDTLKILSQNDFTDIFKVSVFGAVRKPGDFSYGENLTLKDVLLMSGGLRQEAVNNRIEISRIIDYNKTNNKIVPVRAIVSNLQIGEDLNISEEAKNFILQPYDQVYIRSNPEFVTPRRVFISGEVMFPGVYSLLRKDETVAEVIQRAGGLTTFAYLGGVTMSTKYQGTGLVYLNMERALRNSHSKYNIVLNDSDMINIPKTLDMVHISGSIGMSNFQNVGASYSSNINFQKVSPSAWNNGSTLTTNPLNNMPQQNFNNTNTTGNVNTTSNNTVNNNNITNINSPVITTPLPAYANFQSISAPYFNNKRARYYIKHFAGGFSKESQKSRTYVVYPNGIVKKTKDYWVVRFYPKVKNGSNIQVPYKDVVLNNRKKGAPLDWNKAIENATVKITAVLTLWLLLTKIK